MPKIGDYRPKSQQAEPTATPKTAPQQPVLPAPQSARPQKTTPSKQVLDAVEKGVEKDLVEAEPIVEKALTYEELLKQNDVTLEHAQEILDAMLVDGLYEETIQLTSKTSVVFRSRTHRDTKRLRQALEALQPRLRVDMDAIITSYCLAGSLQQYRDEVFVFPPDDAPDEQHEEAFDVRMRRIERLPEPVVDLLARKLAKFDLKLSVILSEGAVEAF